METSRSEERMKHVAEVALKSVFGPYSSPSQALKGLPHRKDSFDVIEPLIILYTTVESSN